MKYGMYFAQYQMNEDVLFKLYLKCLKIIIVYKLMEPTRKK